MIFLFCRRLAEVRSMPEEVFLRKFESEEKSFSDLYRFLAVPIIAFLNKNIIPVSSFLKAKMIGKIRKITVKLGKALLRFDNYLYGRNQINLNGGKSEYWDEVGGFKKDSRGDKARSRTDKAGDAYFS